MYQSCCLFGHSGEDTKGSVRVLNVPRWDGTLTYPFFVPGEMLYINILALTAALLAGCGAQRLRNVNTSAYTFNIPKITLLPTVPKRIFDGRRGPPGSPAQAAETAFKATHSKRDISAGQYGIGVRVVNSPRVQLSVSGVTNFKGKHAAGIHAIIKLGKGKNKKG